jgi:hypothetical protein
MNPSPTPPDRLRDLVLRWCDDRLTEAETTELDGLLRDRPEAIALFAELAHVNASLENLGPAPTNLPIPTTPRRVLLSPLLALGLAAGLALLAGAAGFFLPRPSSPGVDSASAGPSPSASSAAPWVAVIHHAVGARSSDARPGFRSGQLVAPGRLTLDDGLVHLQFFNGVQLVVQGPADFDILSSEESVCREGKFHAVVPPHANGFKMRSPLGDLVDFGTEFGLDLRRDTDPSLHVFDGEVAFRPREDGTSPARLGVGQAATLRADGVAATGPSDPDLFASYREMNRLQAIANETRLAAWFQRSRFWRTHPSILAYFDFEERDYLAGTVLGESPNPYSPPPEGLVIGAAPREGRWPGKTALAFQRLSDRVRVNLPGTHRQLTLVSWVRLDRVEPRVHALLASERHAPDAVRWKIDAAAGTLSLEIGDVAVVSPPDPGLVSPGGWICLASSYDGEPNRVEHYINGRPLGSARLQGSTAVRIGVADLGNEALPSAPGDFHFAGVIDELMIFSSRLSPAQLEEISVSGQPE